MPGIYIHIPYCKKSCFYCDFHFSVNKKNMNEMISAIKNEIEFYGKSNSLYFDKNEIIETIYFGGGTPSILQHKDIADIIDKIYKNYNVAEIPEITIEANPDNLTLEYCRNLKNNGFNRLSIGIQSFFDEHLKWMNRSHNANQATECIENAHRAGFDNMNLDLIYGFPGLTDKHWLQNLEIAAKTQVKHLSCYSLTVEDKTPLKKLIDTGRYFSPDETEAVNQFRFLQNWAAKNNWEHYEISNLCKDGFYSEHNCSYWKNEKYLGIGPSAHSFNQNVRRWNVSDNKIYIENMSQNAPSHIAETLDLKEKYNDYILTSLRTKWGIDYNTVYEISGINFSEKNAQTINKYSELNYLITQKNNVKLTSEGMLFADKIASDLFAS